MGQRETPLDLNEDLLVRAQGILGTRNIKETIDRALFEVLAADARRKTIARLQSLDIDADELRRQAWEC